MRGPRLITFSVALPLALACAPPAPASDAGSCPFLTQSQDSVRTMVELPTGEYDDVDAFGYITRPEVQSGSGSTDFIGSLQYQRSIGAGGSGVTSRSASGRASSR